MDEVDLSSSTLASFKSVIFNYYKSALAVSYDCEDPRSFKSICWKCNSARPLSRPKTNCSYTFSCIAVLFNIYRFYFIFSIRATAVAVSLPSFFLSFCLFVCLCFFCGEANKIKIKKNSRYFILAQFIDSTNRFENKQRELSPRLLCCCKKTTSQPFCFRYIFKFFLNWISYLTYLAGRVKFNPPFNLRFVLTSVWTTQQSYLGMWQFYQTNPAKHIATH